MLVAHEWTREEEEENCLVDQVVVMRRPVTALPMGYNIDNSYKIYETL